MGPAVVAVSPDWPDDAPCLCGKAHPCADHGQFVTVGASEYAPRPSPCVTGAGRARNQGRLYEERAA